MDNLMMISTSKPSDTAFDYEALRSRGIEHIEKTASAIWTDYNIHDPGITSLEILCYAITDLSYRSQFSIPDLMRKEKDNEADIISEFFTAKNILPNKALTINDYRKLIIDIAGVKNVWLRKKTKQLVADLTNKKLVTDIPAGSTAVPVNIKGEYDIVLEFDIDIKTTEEQHKVIDEIKILLLKNRNLCEDFDEIRIADQQLFRLCCEIEMKPDADATQTLAKAFFDIQLHLTPLVKFYSLQQMLNDKDENYSTDKIFEGPFITKGFIKEKELIASELKKEIHLSDLMQLMLGQKEIISIPEIIFNDIVQTTELENKWVIPIKDSFQPVVDILESNIIVYKNGTPVRVNRMAIKTQYDILMHEYLKQNENISSEDLPFDTGSFRNPENYHSIQHHFPKTYGISHWGLPPDALVERQKQAKQLQGYLLLFDQVLANYLSQLSSVKNLFSVKEETQTYFTQLVKDFKDPAFLFKNYTEILKADGSLDVVASWENSRASVQNAAELKESPQFYKRRNSFIDHLLSRFSESFFEYVNIYFNLFPDQVTDKKILEVKTKFLEKYPEYSSNRALAYNYSLTNKLWDEAENISGFEKRVQRLLGFQNINRRSLVNMYSNIKEEVLADGTKQYSFEVIDKKNEKAILTGNEKFTDKEKAGYELSVALTLFVKGEGVKIVKDATDGKFLIELRDKLNALIATGQKGTKTAAEADKKRLTELLENRCEEGMFLIENLLLLDKNKKEFMPICTDPNCTECNDTDPYSFRVSIVMPAYSNRFLDMDFRNYTERVLREEMPAHLLLKVCWVSNEQLLELEEAYKDWLLVKANAKEDADSKILKRLIEILSQIKSIYPESHLQTCSDKEEKQLFILNKNSLGTQKS
jgi:hypothetical protein